MEEILQQLLKSDLLNEETKEALTKAFTEELENAKSVAVAEAVEVATAEVKVQFAAQFAADKEQLVEALDTKITSLLGAHIEELREDIESFRNLEVEFAEKLVEEKEKMGLQVKADLVQLVETLDVFLEDRLVEEFTELKESIEDVRKIQFAVKLFESFETAYTQKFFDATGHQTKLDESKAAVDALTKQLNESNDEYNKVLRAQEMSRVLEPLHGRTREIMEAILKSVATDKLDESYVKYISRVLHESVIVENKSEKEDASASVLAESESAATVVTEATKVVDGTTTVVEQPQVRTDTITENEKIRLRKIAGIG